MPTLSTLRDLYVHMEWADDAVWKSIPETYLTTIDPELHEKLFHSHFTQKAYLQVWQHEPFVMQKSDQFPDSISIRELSRSFYPAAHAILDAPATDLSAVSIVPWAKYFTKNLGHEPVATTLGESMLQVALHSHYHRAQINTRIRQLGGEPPMIDYIGWLWAGRPGIDRS